MNDFVSSAGDGEPAPLAPQPKPEPAKPKAPVVKNTGGWGL